MNEEQESDATMTMTIISPLLCDVEYRATLSFQ
jgi:hypothetical protein